MLEACICHSAPSRSQPAAQGATKPGLMRRGSLHVDDGEAWHDRWDPRSTSRPRPTVSLLHVRRSSAGWSAPWDRLVVFEALRAPRSINESILQISFYLHFSIQPNA